MKTLRFEPAIGQRYLHRQLGVENRFWVITGISQPRFVSESVQLTFTEEITQRVMRHTVPYLAQQTLEGYLRPQELVETDSDSPPLALTDLVMRMSKGQRQRFKMRVSYVQALEHAGVGISSKSPGFSLLVASHHVHRLASWKSRHESPTGQLDDWVEPKQPAPTSVYRWYLRYRKSGDDMRVLAQEALATRTRSSRKPKEMELLTAFLSDRKAAIGSQSISDLTTDFNRLMARTDPLHTDDVIESLYIEAQIKANQNQTARRGKPSMKSKFKTRFSNKTAYSEPARHAEPTATSDERCSTR